jgi:hypothetical protein
MHTCMQIAERSVINSSLKVVPCMQFDRRQQSTWPVNLDQLRYFQIKSVHGRNPRTSRR